MAHFTLPKEHTQLKKSLFQQQWYAKKILRGYHVPNIPERQFLDRHFTSRIKLQQLTKKEMAQVPPVQSLGFAELERRVDLVVFRSHFACSIWDARRIVVQGHVKINGKVVFATLFLLQN